MRRRSHKETRENWREGTVEPSDIRSYCSSSSSLCLSFRNIQREEGDGEKSEYRGRPSPAEGLPRRMHIVSRVLTLAVNFHFSFWSVVYGTLLRAVNARRRFFAGKKSKKIRGAKQEFPPAVELTRATGNRF